MCEFDTDLKYGTLLTMNPDRDLSVSLWRSAAAPAVGERTYAPQFRG